MSRKPRDLERSVDLFERFREQGASRAKRIDIDVPDAVAVMGRCEFVGYVTTIGGRVELYIHEFAPGSRPQLAAGPRRGQLYLIGGRFRVTERGITDLDARGKPIDAKRRYVVKRVR